MKAMTNLEYIMNISVRDFINQFCLSVGYNEIDFVRLMILFKADDDRVNEWLDSEMIGSRKLTNAELIKASNVDEMAQILADISMNGGYEVPCSVCAGERTTPDNHCCADFSDDCMQGVVKWLESEAEENV